jgi:hypothetical protein
MPRLLSCSVQADSLTNCGALVEPDTPFAFNNHIYRSHLSIIAILT